MIVWLADQSIIIIMSERGNNIRVYVRVRPLSQMETQYDGTSRCLECTDQRSLKVTNFEGTGPNPYLNFAFDKVFEEKSIQQDVFQAVAEEIICAAFEGINGTIFCYGQTASGKTYTCVGPELNGQKRGLLPRIIQNVMDKVRIRPSNIDLRAKVSLVEIYNEKVTDLLDLTRRNLKLRQNRNKGVFIEHVTERYISRAEEGYQLLALGLENRSVGCTQMNAVSSRSHMLFMITLVQNDFATGEAKSARLTVIDLAGSEKISKTGTQGKLMSEAIKINTSLSALGNVIHALSENKSGHIPYRDSKLTRLLQQSLGGNSLTSLIVNVSSSTFNEAETVTSLRFGQRAKAIKNSPKINKQYTVEQLQTLLEKAELKIKAQNKIIEELTKKKRAAGAYGIIPDKSLTLHILKDQEEDADSNGDSMSQVEEKPKKKGKMSFRRPSERPLTRKSNLKSDKAQIRTNVKAMTTSLKSIQGEISTKPVARIIDNDSITSEQNLLQDDEEDGVEKFLAKTRSQAELLPSHHDIIIEQNFRLRDSLEAARLETQEVREELQRVMAALETYKSEAKLKEQLITKKNIMIERLKLKNQQRKAEIQKEINNLKKFWEKYYQTDEEERPKVQSKDCRLPSTLSESDSTATLRNTRIAQRTKITRSRTECPSPVN